ncbi:helix-turn-helix transcriptional regulator [Halorussus caseinilyticus]|uniref:helix-turn-helix transcriptional regulator n=1 Tax=Halorussus caseinilyticus TaxID=3034025 RepID=UPI0023E7C3E2|nr:winged helix-turn-helix transcriptional regulator [Halorussus sp. DT72]
MTDDTDLHDVISTVVKRASFLDRLTDGPTSKRDLRDELNLSRSTVYKAVRELETHGLVTESDEGVELTLVGRLLADQYREFEARAAGVYDNESLLSVLPDDAPVTTDLLLGADTVLAERHAPTRPVTYIEALVRNADSVSGVVPVVLPQYVDLFHGELVTDDLTADLVLEDPVVEYLSDEHGERFGEALATGRLSIRRTDETLPFGLIAAEGDGIILIGYEGGGELRGIIRNDTPAALDWGERVFRNYWDEADEVL